MKTHYWAAFVICACLLRAAPGQEALAPSGHSLAVQGIAPNLDPDPLNADRPEPPSERPEPMQEEAPPPPATVEPEPVFEMKTEDLGQSANAKQSSKKWKLIPFGHVRVNYDDNVFISATARQADFYFSVAPGVALGWGDYSREVRQLGEYEHYFPAPDLDQPDQPQNYVFMEYNPNALIFSKFSDQDAIDQDAQFAGRLETSKLSLGLRLRYQRLSGSDVDVGDRVKRNIYSGQVMTAYNVSDKTALELNLYNTSYDYATATSWREWTLEDWLDYQILPKTKISIGTQEGITSIEGAHQQTFERLVARFGYVASTKLAFTVDGGLERRQFGLGVDDSFAVFNGAMSYAPFDGTNLSLVGYRRNSASVSLSNDTITSTGFAFHGSQRFLHRFHLTLDAGYQNSDYRSDLTGAAAGRSDDTLYIKPTISFDVTKHLSAETSYQYQRNESSLAEFSFVENIVAFQLNLQF